MPGIARRPVGSRLQRQVLTQCMGSLVEHEEKSGTHEEMEPGGTARPGSQVSWPRLARLPSSSNSLAKRVLQ